MRRLDLYPDGIIVSDEEAKALAYEVANRWNLHAELVSTLKAALEASGCDGDLCAYPWHEDARRAIAKAEGRDE